MSKVYERNYRTDMQLRSEYYIIYTDINERSFAIRWGDEVIVQLKSGIQYSGTVFRVGTKYLVLKTEYGTHQIQWNNSEIVDSIYLIHKR